MNKLLIFLFVLVLNLNLWAGYTDLSGKIAARFSEKTKQEDGMQVGCMGGSMMGDIRVISLLAQGEVELTLLQLRALIIKHCEQFTSMVNEDLAIRPYLHEYPFTIRNIEFFYIFQGRKGQKIKTPYVEGAVVNEGKIIYTIYDEKGKVIKPKISELYDDAYKIARGSRSNK